MSKRARFLVILVVVIIAAVAVAFLPRVPQPQQYHDFADHRSFAGIPNAMNVLSSLAFLITGFGGLSLTFSRKTRDAFAVPSERLPFAVFFLGAALTCLGSIYYHLVPNNWTLLWDRLPMTVAFMAVVAAIIGERISPSAGLKLLLPLLLLGVATVLYWYITELHGAGDLRPYLCVQFFPGLVILLMLLLFEPKYTRAGDYIVVFALYGLAKIFEAYDRQIFSAGHIFSGHTLKHLAAAGAVFWLARMVQKRRPVPIFRSRLAKV